MNLCEHRGTKSRSKWLKMTTEQIHIKRNTLRVILSCLAHSLANLVSKNDFFQQLFKMIVMKH